jgi:hypothetical protein
MRRDSLRARRARPGEAGPGRSGPVVGGLGDGVQRGRQQLRILGSSRRADLMGDRRGRRRDGDGRWRV